MNEAQKTKTPAEYNVSKNMYINLWHSMTSRPKHALAGLRPKICDDGPSFLFYLIMNYAGTTPQIVRSTQKKIDTLNQKMSRVLKWIADKFCTYMTLLMLQISENGG